MLGLEGGHFIVVHRALLQWVDRDGTIDRYASQRRRGPVMAQKGGLLGPAIHTSEPSNSHFALWQSPLLGLQGSVQGAAGSTARV